MISVTQLCSYIYCKRKLYLEKVLGLAEPPKEATALGSIRHKVYEEINRLDEEIVKSISKADFDEILSLYRERHSRILKETIEKNEMQIAAFNLQKESLYETILPLIDAESRSRAENVFNFIEKNRVYGKELWEKLEPKISSELKIISSSMDLVGVVDRLEVFESYLIPYELKTGKSPRDGVWPGHRVQITAYCMLLEERYGSRISSGVIHYLDGNEKRKVVMNPFMKMEVLDLIKEVKLLLSAQALPEFATENKCRVCGLREDCYNEKKLNKRLKEVFTIQ